MSNSDQVNNIPELRESSNTIRSILKELEMNSHQARVALCMDISGTMRNLYRTGKLQALAEKMLALSSSFDDNASIDVFLFGDATHYAGEMNTENFKGYIENIHKKYMSVGGTFYGKAIKRIREFYFPDGAGGERTKIVPTGDPVLVMFVSDGSTADEEETVEQLRWASYEPIFWQFMAIGKSKEEAGSGLWGWLNKPFLGDFSFLRFIDDMGERNVDNVGFFSVSDPSSLSDEQLFRLLLKEYPDWLKIARKINLVKG
jgi:hypothetical protein